MHSKHVGQSLAVAVTLSLALLIAGVSGFEVAIQQGVIALPDLDVQISGLRIVAYTTGTSECPPYPYCSYSRRNQYVVWVFQKTAPDHLNGTDSRKLIIPLKR